MALVSVLFQLCGCVYSDAPTTTSTSGADLRYNCIQQQATIVLLVLVVVVVNVPFHGGGGGGGGGEWEMSYRCSLFLLLGIKKVDLPVPPYKKRGFKLLKK